MHQPNKEVLAHSSSSPITGDALKGTWECVVKVSVLLAVTYVVASRLVSALPATGYRELPIFGNRVAIWIAAQLHLMFAAFVLGVPISRASSPGCSRWPTR